MALAAVAALFFGMVAQGAEGDKVTGGGQTMVGSTGAGDTIALTAHEGAGGLGSGQVQFVDRDDGTGQGQTVYHGIVSCVRVESSMDAILAGNWTTRGRDKTGGTFEIRVRDNGPPADGEDQIIIRPEANPNCSDDDGESNTFVALGRGNMTIHKR